MHEAKRLRAKCLRVRGVEIVLRLLLRRPARRRGFGASIFEQFSTSAGFGASIFDNFSTSGGFGASIFDDFRRLEAPQRGFSRFLEAASRQPPPGCSDFLHNFCVDKFRNKPGSGGPSHTAENGSPRGVKQHQDKAQTTHNKYTNNRQNNHKQCTT